MEYSVIREVEGKSFEIFKDGEFIIELRKLGNV